METNITMYEFNNDVTNANPKKYPKYLRTYGIADDGGIFLPAKPFFNEDLALLFASQDGKEVLSRYNHIFLESSYLEEISNNVSVLKKVVGYIKENHYKEESEKKKDSKEFIN